MMHRVATVGSDAGRIEVGYLVCVGEPSVCMIGEGADGKPWPLCIRASEIDALIEALRQAAARARANDPR